MSTLTLESILNPAPLTPSRHITQADSSAVHFNDFDISDSLKQRLAAANFVIPTPVQAGAIPPALEGADILATASTGTGHLQKGHAVACGDWDRDGDVDIFIETGGMRVR